MALLARRWPHGLYNALDQLARATAPLARRRATVQRACAVFPDLSPAEHELAARELRSSMLKSAALGMALAGSPRDPIYPPLAVDPAFAAVRGPAILTSFHCDAVGAVGGALRRIPGEVFALHRMQWTLPSNVVGHYVVDQTESAGAAAFYRALATLRRGGCVLLLVDGAHRSGHTVSLLGRAARLWRGTFALARLTGAPIVPLLARWNGSTVEVVCGDTIAATEDEPAMAQAMAAVLEHHLLQHPGAIGQQLLDQLSRAPRLALQAAP